MFCSCFIRIRGKRYSEFCKFFGYFNRLKEIFIMFLEVCWVLKCNVLFMFFRRLFSWGDEF